MPNPKSKIPKRQTLVWRFVAYWERFGYDPGKMPVKAPQYVRWYINGWDAPSSAVVGAVRTLRAEPDFIWLQGAAVELLTVTAGLEQSYQGYLCTGRRPSTSAELGSILRVDGRKVPAVLNTLCRYGLLEQVPFDIAGGKGPDRDVAQRSPSKSNDSRRSKKAARKTKPSPATDSTKRPSRAKNKASPLNKTRIEKTAAQKSIEIGEGPPGERRASQTGARPQGPPGGGQGDTSGAQATTAPTARPATSTISTSPDAGAGPAPPSCREAAGRNAGPASIIKLGRVAGLRPARYSPAAMDFAAQVLTATGYRHGDRGQTANELAHWAKAHDGLTEQFDSATVRKVASKVLTVARSVRDRRGQFANPEAYVQTAMRNEIRDAVRAGKGVG